MNTNGIMHLLFPLFPLLIGRLRLVSLELWEFVTPAFVMGWSHCGPVRPIAPTAPTWAVRSNSVE